MISQCWRWPIGSCLLTVAWINLLSYFQQLPSLGIFILMFKDVLFTMLRFLLIMAVFIIAFGLGFHLLFMHNNVRMWVETLDVLFRMFSAHQAGRCSRRLS